jgi:DNA-directed RNA polymerase subunit RPC12/RpoP
MICEKCKKDTLEEYTSKDNKIICRECLEQEIYKQRKQIIKKNSKKAKQMDMILMITFIGFCICYTLIMLLVFIKMILR